MSKRMPTLDRKDDNVFVATYKTDRQERWGQQRLALSSCLHAIMARKGTSTLSADSTECASFSSLPPSHSPLLIRPFHPLAIT
ncbi:unnamed protein product [Protopolystoma xenopodis]|uniref:Uncharacterized protein n=1 Tax=Protopolystoma xenopodis TaxID=117903 RepID=A0A448XSU9_9PLAT|nr:unnamed protein product [Protopolystoma xenopodis]